MDKPTVRFAARLLACVVLLSPVAASAFQGEITTYAGAGSGGETGDGGPATVAKIQGPGGQAMDAAGNLFFADTDNHRVRRVDASTGVITTVAGNGSQGFSGDGGAATAARLRFPHGVAVATNGDFYIADSDNHRIRLVTAATGVITTTAGDGNEGASGDGGPATAASLDEPFDVALDASGRLTIADTGNHRIRRVSAAGIISTIAGTGSGGYGGDNGPATAADLHSPSGIAYDISSDLFIADTENNRVRKVDISLGTIRTFAGDGSSGYGGDGGSALNAKLKKPGAVALDADRHLYIADTQNNRLRRVEHGAGVIMTIAGTGLATYDGDGVAAVSASLRNPAGIVVSATGDAFIGDTGNHRIRRVEDPAFTECGDGVLEIGEECDDGNTSSGDCCSSSCKTESAGTQCRAEIDACDAPEVCDGVASTCPTDFVRPAGTICRTAAGLCDIAETCNGLSVSCPADATEAPGTVCRGSAGTCDVQEVCTGATICPSDSYVSGETTCRASAGTCDPAETCTGAGPACPGDALHNSSTVCRPGVDLCDAIELCSGADATCPADGLHAAGTVCRSVAGVCDIAEICDGLIVACPSDALIPAGTQCRASTDLGCDPGESCTGANAFCPGDYMESDGTICDDSDPFTENESCIDGTCGCLGGDLDGDTIPDSCDLEDALIEVNKLTARWGKLGKGQVSGKGTFEIGPLGPFDVFDVSDGLTFTVGDATQTIYAQVQFLAQECGTAPNGSVKCKTTDKSANASFRRKEVSEGIFEYKFKFKIGKLDLLTDLATPVRVAIEIGVLDRTGEIPLCFPKTAGLRCKQ
ncbi:MAG: hypothetical protein P8R42_18615 [Candidatus Binatia bacterium]|nr:hypothetical protein [Candidatus Binatia bacterium]